MTELDLTPEKYDQVLEAIKEVIDPEIGVNIVDLGLIYDLKKSEDDALLIHMTLTSAGCPLTDVIEEQMGMALDGVVEAFRINWVWMPPWGPELITDDGKEQMRALGLDELSLHGETQKADGSTSAAALTLGKRISRQLYLSYTRSMIGATGTVAVLYDLTRNFTVRAQAGDENALDLIFTRQYDGDPIRKR